MKKIFLVAVVILFCCPYDICAFSLKTYQDEGVIEVQSECRQLSQGEVVKISIRAPSPVRATARFDGQEYVFVPAGDDSRVFTIIGLSLYTEPGIHELQVSVAYAARGEREFFFNLPVSENKFLQARITVGKSYIHPSQKQQDRMKRERALLKEVYGRYTEQWLGSGTFIRPLKGKITGPFGTERIFNGEVRSRHRGIDIRSPRGRSVGAANAGRVILARDLYLAGGTVIIDHGIGLFSLYLHLSKITVKEGSLVGKGKKVGLVGSTGRSSGPHLHWGFRVVDRYVDPESMLRLTF